MKYCKVISKFFVLLLNFIFGVTGILLLLLGVIFKIVSSLFSDYFEGHLGITSTLILILGLVAILTSFFGFYGAFKENRYVLFFYSVFIVIAVVIDITVGVFAALNTHQEGTLTVSTKDMMQKAFHNYDNYNVARKSVNQLQTNLECCGINGPADWSSRNETILPWSCCHANRQQDENSDTAGLCLYNQEHYKTGCLQHVQSIVDEIEFTIRKVVIVVSVVLLLDIIAALCLAILLKKKEDIHSQMCAYLTEFEKPYETRNTYEDIWEDRNT